jgi:hypothetical protein
MAVVRVFFFEIATRRVPPALGRGQRGSTALRPIVISLSVKAEDERLVVRDFATIACIIKNTRYAKKVKGASPISNGIF